MSVNTLNGTLIPRDNYEYKTCVRLLILFNREDHFFSCILALVFGNMFLQNAIVPSLMVVLSTHVAPVTATAPEDWYKAHPGLSRISKVNQDTHQIVDEFGRTRFFHGTNVVMKEPPWYRPAEWVPGTSSFGEQDVKNMQALGLNVVRLGHHWAGAEPTRGQYNQTFLDIMKKQTKLAEEHGLYVLVDVHQDVLARQLCGHGVPDVSAQQLTIIAIVAIVTSANV